MELDDEIPETKTYTTLTNVNTEIPNDFEFKFEKFLLSGNSDSEDEEILLSSDDSDSEEEHSNFDFSISSESNSSPNFSLTTEDWSVINSSQNPELKKALMLNRNAKYLTLQLFNKIKGILVSNQEKIRSLRQSLEKNESKEHSMMLLGQLGAPFFRTKKDMFCSDPNKDTLDRRKRGLLSIYQTQTMSSKWSKSECDKLSRGVQLNYNHNKQKAILGEITNLKEKLTREGADSEIAPNIIDKIEQLEDKIKELRAIGINDIPPLSQNKFINWDHIATEFLMDKHNAQECSAFWHIYLHPNINKSNWTNEENEKIRVLAEKYGKQDWDRIAAELGTNRSGFSVFLYYSSALCDQVPKSRFTEEEDAKLIEIVDSRKIGSYIPWNLITEFFPHRTKYQIMHRYRHYLRNLDQYTRQFSDAEDILILIMIERFGRNYIKFTKYLPSKSYMQIKSRYDNHLRFKRIKGYFTLEEDRQILSHFKGMRNVIGNLTVTLNRNRLQIRQRYLKLKEYFEKYPNKTLECIPRRGGVKQETFRRLEFLNCIKDQFKDYVDIPTLEEVQKKLGMRKQSKTHHDIDVMLVNFFSTSYAIKQKPIEISISKITNAADQIYNILKSWRVNLEIPEELRKNNTLDVIDLEILSSLRNRYHSDIHTPSIEDLLPPNMNSLIGLRGLLLKNRIFRNSDKRVLTLKDNLPFIRNNRDREIACELQRIFNNKDISTQCIIQNERSLFLERFVSVFMWPALLSIESPSEIIANMESRSKSERSANKKKVEKKCRSKPIKRSIAGSSNNLGTKKIKLSCEKQQMKEEPQPQRFSSRLKSKKQISNTNESTQNDEEFSAVNGAQNLTSADGSLPNSENPKKQDQIQTKSENVTINNSNAKIISRNINQITHQKLPPNLIKVDKSEIIKLLQNKKPIKIFKILSIQKPDGSIAVPSPSNVKITEIVENQEQSTTSESSGFVPDVENLRNNLMAKFSKNTNNIKTDPDKNKNKLNKSIKNKRSKPVSYTNKNLNRVPESSVKSVDLDHADDLNKLDAFLNNVDDDYTIDLTESEVMKNEVDQLDQLIKQESTFDLTSF